MSSHVVLCAVVLLRGHWSKCVLVYPSIGSGGKLYGIVVISGTGMIAYGYGPNGESARAGGWGPLLGDCGSGYDIGFEVLKAVARSKV